MSQDSLNDDPRIAELAELGKRPGDLGGGGYASDSEVYQTAHRALQDEDHSPEDINRAVIDHWRKQQ